MHPTVVCLLLIYGFFGVVATHEELPQNVTFISFLFDFPAYILADNGYDVWMGNFRGNTYSKAHCSFSPLSSKFWEFSFHEMGIYDLPAAISYITNVRFQPIHMYIGHSMGTTAFYVMASKCPQITQMVEGMISLAPVAFVNFIVRVLQTLLPSILSHCPAGTSTRTMVHLSQGIQTGKFRPYDYGSKKNMQIYNATEPPDYDFTNITVPIALFYADNDWFVSNKDLKKLHGMLNNVLDVYRVPFEKFNHVDFLWGKDAPQLVYKRLLYLINKSYFVN